MEGFQGSNSKNNYGADCETTYMVVNMFWQVLIGLGFLWARAPHKTPAYSTAGLGWQQYS